MARRESLIPAGSLLDPTQVPDLQRRIIANDAAKHGRPGPSFPAVPHPTDTDKAADNRSPSNEGFFIPSNDEMSARAEEGTKEGAPVGTSAPTNQRRKVPTGARGSGGTRTPSSARKSARVGEDTSEGAGKDWLADVLLQASSGRDVVAKGAQSRLNVDIDDDLHARLKMHVLKNKTTLRKLLPLLLEAYLKEVGE